MLRTKALMIAACAIALAGPLKAETAAGVWRTQADGKGQTALVTARPCGDALCGTITQVMNAQGEAIDHPNVGRRVFWDMREVLPGNYEGVAYVPAFGSEYPAQMTLSGTTLKVGGCVGPICRDQTWTRVE